MWNGHPSNVVALLLPVRRRARRFGLVPTATTDGRHAPGSLHYVIRGRRKGHAIDFGFTPHDLGRLSARECRRRLEAFQRAEYERARRLRWRTYRELIGPRPDLVILGGRPCPIGPFSELAVAHRDHVHVGR